MSKRGKSLKAGEKKTRKNNTNVKLDDDAPKSKEGVQTRRLTRNIFWTYFCQILGAVVLLGSWTTDNIMRKNSEAEKQTLESIRNYGTTATLNKDIYEAEQMSLGYIFKKDTSIRNAYLHCLHTYCQIIIDEYYTAKRAIIEDKADYNEIDEIRNIDSLRDSLNRFNDSLSRVNSDSGLIHEFFGLHQLEADSIGAFSNNIIIKENVAIKKIKHYNLFFIVAYISGSILLVVGLILKLKIDLNGQP